MIWPVLSLDRHVEGKNRCCLRSLHVASSTPHHHSLYISPLLSPSPLRFTPTLSTSRNQDHEMGQFWTFLGHLSSLAGPTLMLLYPLYASVIAIESPSKLDDEQWLAYWIIYSFLTLLEMVAEPVLYWVPIWYHFKVLLVAWLVLPQFRGAAFIYDRFVREQMRKYGAKGKGGAASPVGKGHEAH